MFIWRRQWLYHDSFCSRKVENHKMEIMWPSLVPKSLDINAIENIPVDLSEKQVSKNSRTMKSGLVRCDRSILAHRTATSKVPTSYCYLKIVLRLLFRELWELSHWMKNGKSQTKKQNHIKLLKSSTHATSMPGDNLRHSAWKNESSDILFLKKTSLSQWVQISTKRKIIHKCRWLFVWLQQTVSRPSQCKWQRTMFRECSGTSR